ncbi:MAG: DUF5317 domain-containing protein [Clostridiales bacterium]|nr:DUF5317 domain-containing protein [Clostridiales bacterium]
MLWLIPIVLGILVGFLRGGSWKSLAQTPIRGGVLLAVGVGLQLALRWLPDAYQGMVHSFSYFFLLAFLLLNWELPGMAFLVAGTLLNGLVIIANGGKMPVEGTFLKHGLRPDGIHQLASPDTLFPYLGDWIAAPYFGGQIQILSPGDLALMVGLFWLVQQQMVAGARASRR